MQSCTSWLDTFSLIAERTICCPVLSFPARGPPPAQAQQPHATNRAAVTDGQSQFVANKGKYHGFYQTTKGPWTHDIPCVISSCTSYTKLEAFKKRSVWWFRIIATPAISYSINGCYRCYHDSPTTKYQVPTTVFTTMLLSADGMTLSCCATFQSVAPSTEIRSADAASGHFKPQTKHTRGPTQK